MGRNISTMRQEINAIIERWQSFMKAMHAEDKQYMEKIIEKAKRHTAESSYSLEDPLEAVILSVLIEVERELMELEKKCSSQ
ncbi:MAG: hypothetical protein ACP5L4_00020 [Thermoplasmata archaeon]